MMISAAEAAAASHTSAATAPTRGIVMSRSLLQLKAMDEESIDGTPPLTIAVQRLTKLRKSLRSIADPKKDALNQARMMDLDAVDDESFWLMFLRAAKFDPTASAYRLMEHFQQKLQLFVGGGGVPSIGSSPQSSLTRQLQLSDLKLDDLEALSSGGIEVFLPPQTSNESFIVFNYVKMANYLATKPKNNFLRALFFVLHSATQHKQVQEEGLQFLTFAIDKNEVYCSSDSIVDETFWKTIVKVICSVPVRITSIHHSSRFGARQDMFADLLARTTGTMPVINHYGSYNACIAELATHGMPVSLFSSAPSQPPASETKVDTSIGTMSDNQMRTPQFASSQNQALGFGSTMGAFPHMTPSAAPAGASHDVNDSLVATLQSLQSLTSNPGMLPVTPVEPPVGLGGGIASLLGPGAAQSGILGTNRLLESLQTQQLGGVGAPNAFQLGGLSSLAAAPMAGLQGQLQALTAQLQGTSQSQLPAQSNFGNISQLMSNPAPAAAPPIQLQITDAGSVLDQMLGNPIPQASSIGSDSDNALRNLLIANAAAPCGQHPEEKLEDHGSVASSHSRTIHSMPGNTPAASHAAAGPSSSDGIPPICLYVEGDENKISAYQCLARQQIELFAATDDDVQFNTSKMNKMIVAGQVGIRCRHCAVLPQYSRPKAAVYYPRTLDSLYQFGQNMVKNHLGASCKLIPHATRKKMEDLKDARRRGRGGREHWASAAKALGVYEDASGLRFK